MGLGGPRVHIGVEDEDENVMVGEPLPSPGSGLLQVPQVSHQKRTQPQGGRGRCPSRMIEGRVD